LETFTGALKHKEKVEQRVVVGTSVGDLLLLVSHSEEKNPSDGNCITSRAPGTALEFALQLVERLYGESKAQEVQRTMLVPSY